MGIVKNMTIDPEKLSKYSIISSPNRISGDGLLESNLELRGIILDRFYVGAFTKLSVGSVIHNSFIGRFCSIGVNVSVGELRNNLSNFSNHFFAHDESMSGGGVYLKSLQSRFYYERGSYTFIGDDVYIGRNSVIYEGVKIGDGAYIYPNSVVLDDVPDYAVAAGIPARVIGFRFSDEVIRKLKSINWPHYDIESSFREYNKLPNRINLVDDRGLIDYLYQKKVQNKLNILEIARVYINTTKGIIKENSAVNMITGPSHVDIWFRKYNRGEVTKPEKCHLFPLPAVSLFSDNLRKLVFWWTRTMGKVVLFVPDFRIGNSAVDKKKKNGRFIYAKAINDYNDKRCYALGCNALDQFAEEGKVLFLFWCLFGREMFNRSKSNHTDPTGQYRHPIWNYDDLLRKYRPSSIDIRTYFKSDGDFRASILDESIHPTNACYDRLSRIIDTLL